MRAHRLSALPLLFGLALPLSGLAAPELSVRLNDQPLSPSWNALAADRYDTLLELEPGRLHLVMPQAGVENTALAPFRRQPLGKDSAYRYEVPEAGRYRLIVETGASAALRLLPIKAAEPKTAVPVCRVWDGGAVNVAVGDVFRDGQTLRDARRDQVAAVVSEPAGDARESEGSDAPPQDSGRAEGVREAGSGQQRASERDPVTEHDPRRRFQAEVEVLPDRRQGNVHHRHVEHHDELRHARHPQSRLPLHDPPH